MAKNKNVTRPAAQPPGPSQEDVLKLAQNLGEWAGHLPKKQQALLHRLLSRAVSREMPVGQGRYERDTPKIDETNVKQAVADALWASSVSGAPHSSGPGWTQWLLSGWFRGQSVSK